MVLRGQVESGCSERIVTVCGSYTEQAKTAHCSIDDLTEIKQVTSSQAGARPVFITRRGDRLAARIKNVLYAWRFARQVDGQTIISWLPRDRSFYGVLASEAYNPILLWDLPRFYAEGGLRELVFMEGPYRGDPSRRALAGPDFAENRPNAFKRDQFLGRPEVFEDTDHVVYQFDGETRHAVEEEVRQLYRRLPLSQEVGDTVGHAKKIIGQGEYVCLHLRRGDIPSVLRAAREEMKAGVVSNVAKVYAVHAALRTAPFAFYHAAVEEALSIGQKIVFFSDSPDTFRHFALRYGPASFVDGTKFALAAKTDVQKAFVDFNLIAGARDVIGTSTGYSSIATLIGGGRLLTVTAAGSLDAFTQYFFDEVLEGEALPSSVRDELISAFRPRYEIYQDKWRRLQARRTLPRPSTAAVA